MPPYKLLRPPDFKDVARFGELQGQHTLDIKKKKNVRYGSKEHFINQCYIYIFVFLL